MHTQLAWSLILIAWSGLIWLNREQVAAGRPLIHAGFWTAIGLILLAKGVGELRRERVGGDLAEKRPVLVWLIGALAISSWIAPRWGSIPFLFTESSYAATLSASVVAAMVALLAALAIRAPLPGNGWTRALRLGSGAGAAAAFVLVGMSVWIHLRVDHSETGRYGEMAATLFVVEHPVLWAIVTLAAFALWWSRRNTG